MNPDSSPVVPKERIIVVDALRGVALSGIMLLHQIEHFNYYRKPLSSPDWLSAIDGNVWNTLFFIFGGKAYATFSLLFGFSFWLQFSNWAENGYDFGGRFLWRMVLLFGFGMLHTVVFSGDIVILYAVFAIPLFFTRKWPDWSVLLLAILLLVRPLDLVYLLVTLLGGDVTAPKVGNPYWQQLGPFLSGESFWELCKANFAIGIKAHSLWSWNVGRVFQAPGLFLLGVFVARKGVFLNWNVKRWLLLFCSGVAGYFLFVLIRLYVTGIYDLDQARSIVGSVFDSYGKLSLAASFVSLVFIVWNSRVGGKILGALAPYGRMSLTNYLMQSAIGTVLYHGWAFALWEVAGSTISLGIGLIVLAFQIVASHWWLKRHKQGPLESVWRNLTWLGYRR